MKFAFKPRTASEKFGKKIYNLLVENFPRTYLVGGTARDILLNKKVCDIDIATQAKPKQVAKILAAHKIKTDSAHRQFGVIIAFNKNSKAEIATLRTEAYQGSRYPKIKYTASPKADSQRRDFTINSLYLSPKTGKILDFHSGLKDLNSRLICFVGQPQKKIKQDPLRIVRALRFALSLNFSLEKNSGQAIKNNFWAVKTLTQSRLNKEVDKILSLKDRRHLKNILKNPNLLDKLINKP